MSGFGGVLRRYGQRVTRVSESGVAVGMGLAMIQPILEKQQAQFVPSPLGMDRRDRFLYLGDLALDGIGSGWIDCGGVCYDVTNAQAVYLGERLSHWWAVLTVREAEV